MQVALKIRVANAVVTAGNVYDENLPALPKASGASRRVARNEKLYDAGGNKTRSQCGNQTPFTQSYLGNRVRS